MPSILVVEQERRYIERINDALGAEGWKTRVVGSQAEALRAGASEAPDLVLVSADIPGVEAVASSFSRSAGGPGVIALLAENAAQAGVGGIEADELLAKPFTEQELRLVVRRALAARRAAAAPPPPPTTDEPKLTSRDIFGDMLAEVEKEVAAPAAPPAPTAAQAAATRREEEINRKLEQTLSGVFGLGASAKAKPAASAAPPKRSDAKGDDLDALISKTLSGLGATGKAAGATTPAASTPRPAPPPPAASPAAATVPAPAAAGAAGAEARKPPKTAADLGFSELEELARPRRRPEPAAAPAPAPAKPQAPAGPAPASPAPPPAPPRTAPQAPVRTVAPPPPPQRVDAPMATQQIPVAAGGQQPGERFGQYTLQEKVAAGGMAEVWKARMRGVEGFQKTVAIKKILPHLTDNSEFIGMFIDEAKLAAQLSHPNIIHIYDLGKIGRDYYIAMEYVEGKDLRSIMNAARKKSLPLPLGLALLVASRLASALDYAHRKRDFEGRELGLVHRDVSPQNVLITFEGDIKLCDFGIAKAVTKASQTQMGALKGKLQYMSPEQAWGKPVDSRSDIFSLGAILFEMLTGERLFPGGSEISVLEAVRDGRTRTAREISPAVPPEVDEIVRRALAREPDQRFASAGEMQSRLESVLYGLKPTPGPTDLAAYLHRLFQADDPLVAATTAAAVAAAPAAQPAAEPAAPPPPEPPPDEYAPAPAAPTAPLAPIPPLGGGPRRGGRAPRAVAPRGGDRRRPGRPRPADLFPRGALEARRRGPAATGAGGERPSHRAAARTGRGGRHPAGPRAGTRGPRQDRRQRPRRPGARQARGRSAQEVRGPAEAAREGARRDQGGVGQAGGRGAGERHGHPAGSGASRQRGGRPAAARAGERAARPAREQGSPRRGAASAGTLGGAPRCRAQTVARASRRPRRRPGRGGPRRRLAATCQLFQTGVSCAR